ncbi:MAG: macro domain-containing protein [Limnoraphis sp. WC205]|jgi:O-acetyl-ADP-ribose deacetylase (regulator of RNase III)|nr:macro domain-containing protein [Limnoraphis sp. WC205]
MIKFKQGNLIEENIEALVNTVNCVGVMGKGIALQFKQAFPENFKHYKKACDIKKVQPGKMFTTSTDMLFPKYIINFPTKRHWKGKSKIEDIESGLKALVEEVQQLNIQSIAIPPLGCGNGGLDWTQVKPMIVNAFAELPDVQVIIFEPVGAPVADKIKVATNKPNMTLSRALFIRLLELYAIPGYQLTKLEIQKLAYFLQEAQEPLELGYTKHDYGPYADNLNHVLEALDGHFIRGFGDRSQQSQMYVLPEGRKAAHRYLEQLPEANERLERVSNLITGFETPYGMEMLATIHWVVTREDPQAAKDCERAIALVQQWNERKRKLFKPSHLRKAWERLKQQNWFLDVSTNN